MSCTRLRVELPYATNSQMLFEQLRVGNWPVFLDSGYPHKLGGRFDILSADPYLQLITRNGCTKIYSGSSNQTSKQDPLDLLRKYLPIQEPHSDLPFSGGAIGYFAYDLFRTLEPWNIPFTTRTGLPDMVIGFYDWALVVDHSKQRSTLVSQGQDPNTLKTWQTRVDRLRYACNALPPTLFKATSRLHTNMEPPTYLRAFNKVKSAIREGECYQVNLARRFSFQAQGDPWDAYLRLRQQSPAPFSAFLEYPFGTLLSLSPERFLRTDSQGNVETQPIKGTRARDPNPAKDYQQAKELENAAKDRAENLMIVDLLRNDLGKNCIYGSIQVPKLFERISLPQVHHLVSTITGRIPNTCHPLEVLRGCFPGGSITGAPKRRAMEIIAALEPHSRGIYCGAIGYIGFDGAMDLNISIRTMVYYQGMAYFYAGGGIVADSNWEAEFQETLDKAKAFLDLAKAK